MAEILPIQDRDVSAHPTKASILLDKDGKPCRTCNTYRDFVSGKKKATAAISSAAAVNTVSASDELPADCPPDVEALGRASWTLLHSLAATYPPSATPEQQKEMHTFMGIFSRVYPCWHCAKDFRSWMERPENQIQRYLGGRREFGDWMCRAHNDVNVKLGKKEFDCRLWEQRWKDGWKDGRCD